MKFFQPGSWAEMPLTLEQYAAHLDTKGLPWPAAPKVEPAKAKPHLKPIPGLKAILWNVYGTLLAIPTGDLLFEHPQQLIMSVALDKTIEEFKMWGSMSRKPGAPADYMQHLYNQELLLQKASGGGERYPEVLAERIWESLIKKLFQKDYKFDASFYGSLNEYSRKVAYFFHSSLQGVGPQPDAATALRLAEDGGMKQGMLGDGQCFTPIQVFRALKSQATDWSPESALPASLRILSCDVKARKPSDTIFRQAVAALAAIGIKPEATLHVGTKIARDILPARKVGMKTGLYVGDKSSVEATADQLKDAANRPDVMLTELSQIAEVIP